MNEWESWSKGKEEEGEEELSLIQVKIGGLNNW